MLGNKKSKGDSPKSPPPPPMKPKKIEVEDIKLTAEDLAGVFGVPPHLLSQLKQGSFDTHTAIETTNIRFIKKWLRRMQRLTKECEKIDHEKIVAELNRKEGIK